MGKWETLDSTGNRLLEQFQNLIFITNFIKFNAVSFLLSQQALIENMHIESTTHVAERVTQNLDIHGLQLQTGKNNNPSSPCGMHDSKPKPTKI